MHLVDVSALFLHQFAMYESTPDSWTSFQWEFM